MQRHYVFMHVNVKTLYINNKMVKYIVASITVLLR